MSPGTLGGAFADAAPVTINSSARYPSPWTVGAFATNFESCWALLLYLYLPVAMEILAIHPSTTLRRAQLAVDR